MLHKLEEDGLKARNSHIKAVKDACQKYWDERGKPVADQLGKLIGFPKKKKNKAHKKKNRKEH